MQYKDLFEILVREHQRSLLAFIRTAVNDHATAEDIWQETLLVAWRKLNEFDRTRPFGPWLRGIASRIVMARCRKDSRFILVSDDEALEYLSQKFDSLQNLSGDTFADKLSALEDCIERLPAKDQECVRLKYSRDFSIDELAKTLGIAIEATKKRLWRAKQKLIDCINQKMQNTTDQSTNSNIASIHLAGGENGIR